MDEIFQSAHWRQVRRAPNVITHFLMQVNRGSICKESDLIHKFSAVVGMENHRGRKDAEDKFQLLCRFECRLRLPRQNNAVFCQVIFVHHDPLEVTIRVALHIDVVDLQ